MYPSRSPPILGFSLMNMKNLIYKKLKQGYLLHTENADFRREIGL